MKNIFSSQSFPKLFLLFITLIAHPALSTHLRAGYINVKNSSADLKTVTITITVYLDNESTVPFGGSFLIFGDGSDPHEIPEQMDPTPLDNQLMIATYSVQHTYSEYGFYRLSYAEPNRNEGILNIINSVNKPFYLESAILLDPTLGEINTSEPIFPLFVNFHKDQINTLNLTMTKLNDEVYRYSLSTPKTEMNKPVEYIKPENIALDPITGLFSWDLIKEEPEFEEYFNRNHYPHEFGFAANVYQYKKINNNYLLTGYTTIDFQINVREPAADIVIDSTESEVLVKESEVSLLRKYSSDTKPEIEYATDLPEELFSFSKTEESNRVTANITFSPSTSFSPGPYFFIIRSRTTNNSKDDVITIYLNEKNSFLEEIVSSTSQIAISEPLIYPNPTENSFIVNFEKHQNLQIVIYNMKGKTILNKSVKSGEAISVENAGIYFYTLSNGNSLVKSGKVVVK